MFPKIFSRDDVELLGTRGILVMVSGGPDSVFLLHALVEAIRNKYISGPVEVLHANHHLRGDDADADQRLVEQLCRKWRVRLHIRHRHFRKMPGLPMRARLWRYQLARAILRERGLSFLMTAHHADDQLETLVFRHQRGAGLSGLCGIRRWQSITGSPGGAHLFRPLLHLHKTIILASLQKKHIPYRLDASNEDLLYQRNRIRRALAARPFEPDFSRHILNGAQALSVLDDYFSVRARCVRKYRCEVSRCQWDLWPGELRFRWWRDTLKRLGCSTQLERRHLDILEKQRRIILGRTDTIKRARRVSVQKKFSG